MVLLITYKIENSELIKCHESCHVLFVSLFLLFFLCLLCFSSSLLPGQTLSWPSLPRPHVLIWIVGLQKIQPRLLSPSLPTPLPTGIHAAFCAVWFDAYLCWSAMTIGISVYTAVSLSADGETGEGQKSTNVSILRDITSYCRTWQDRTGQGSETTDDDDVICRAYFTEQLFGKKIQLKLFVNNCYLWR